MLVVMLNKALKTEEYSSGKNTDSYFILSCSYRCGILIEPLLLQLHEMRTSRLLL